MKAKTARWISLALVLIGVGMMALWVARVYRASSSLVRQLAEAEALAEQGPLDADVGEIGALVHGVRADVADLRRDVGWLAPLGGLFRGLPDIGPALGEAPELLALADALTEAGDLLWNDAAPALAAIQQGQAPAEALAEAAPALIPHVPQARAAFERAAAAYQAIDPEALPYRVQEPFALLGELLPLASEGLGAVEHVPYLLGVDEPRTYLLLALNEDELRPGGGYITGVGEVRVQDGEVAAITFRDSYQADDFTIPYPEPPEPLQQFMAAELWVFRDSNWSLDFPRAARQAIELYRPGYPVDVDGLVAVDQHAVVDLVDALGPLAVPGADAPVTGETLFDYIYGAWAPEDGKIDREWWKQRKSFMGPLAEAALAKLEQGEVDWVALVETGLDLIERKHLLVYFAHPGMAEVLQGLDWDGGLREPPGDFLAVAEANVGFNKASLRIARHVTYEVDLAQSPPRATVTLAYTHTSQVEIACKPEARYDPVYEQMMDRCYWAYLRLYVPEGATLLDASRHPIPAEAVANGEPWPGEALQQPAPEGGHTVLAQAVLLPTDSETMVHFTYELPQSVLQEAEGTTVYRLTWQKQPGMLAVPVRVVLRMPENAVLSSVHPEPVSDEGGVVVYEVALERDWVVDVRYR